MKVRYGYITPSDCSTLYDRGDIADKPRVYEPLFKSMKTWACINPVIVSAKKGDLQVIYGLSRMQVADKLKMPIPAIIADYDDRFTSCDEMKTVEEIASAWTCPEIIKPHINLSDNKLWMTHHVRVPINEDGDYF